MLVDIVGRILQRAQLSRWLAAAVTGQPVVVVIDGPPGVGWRFVGQHMRPIPGFGHTEIPATQNLVTVSGMTLVENTVAGQPVGTDLEDLLRADTVAFHRFIDWLEVFAQIGVLHLGRPMPISDIDFKPPRRGTSRVAGYNDRLGDD